MKKEVTSLRVRRHRTGTDIGRTIAVCLVIFGQLYLAIQVAILVGKFIKGSDTKQKEREIEDLKKEIRSLK